jgi:ADP-heptose:LPS heptosyltransferase
MPVNSLFIAHDGQTKTAGAATKLGDTIVAIIVARMWVAQYSPRKVILTLCQGNYWNPLWVKFIADYSVDVIYNPPTTTNKEKYARFDLIRPRREFAGKKFDVYRELYTFLDGSFRQPALRRPRRTALKLGSHHIFDYFYLGQEPPIIPPDDWLIDRGVIACPDIPRKPQVMIAPLAVSQGNKIFTPAFWEAVYTEITAAGIKAVWNTDVAPDNIAAHVAANALVCCGNTGIGWVAAATGTPFLACEHAADLYEYRYDLIKPKSWLGTIDTPDPARMVAAIKQYCANW